MTARSSRRHETVVRIRNIKGLHARASAKFVKCVETFDASVSVTKDDQTVGGSSIMGLMMLAAGPGVQLHLAAEGREAAAVLDALTRLIADGFGEECVGG